MTHRILKLLPLLVFILFLSQQNAFASFTPAETCHHSHGGGGSADTKDQCTGTATAGHLMVMLSQNEGAATILASDSGTSTWVNLTLNTISGNVNQLSYTLSQVSSGSITYTSTWSGSTGGSIIVVDATVVGTPSYDSLDVGASSNSTAADSGTVVTITGADEVVFAGFSNENNPVVSSPLINGAAATCATAVTNSTLCWKTFVSSTFTGQHASATITPSDKWLVSVTAFKATGGGGGGGGTLVPYKSLMGVGK